MAITPHSHASLGQPILRLAYCFRITPAWGPVITITDYHANLDVIVAGTGKVTFTPGPGLQIGSIDRPMGLEERFLAVSGFFDSVLTLDDFRAGRFASGTVEFWMVDWAFSGGVPLRVDSFLLDKGEWKTDRWSLKLTGLTAHLRRPVGRTATRTCPYSFGDADCKLTRSTFSESKTVSSIDTQRRIFRASTLLTQVDGFYDWGLLEWTSGNNNAITSIVGLWTDTGRIMALRIPTPFDIQVGDAFTIFAGDDHTFATCRDKFDNVKSDETLATECYKLADMMLAERDKQTPPAPPAG